MNEPAKMRTASVADWQAYLTNRPRRARDGRFLIQGARPVMSALRHGWKLETLLYRLGNPELSSQARELIDTSGLPAVGLLPELIAVLGDELVAVARVRTEVLADFAPPGAGQVIVVLDGPESPDELGTAIHNAVALGACAVVIAGRHAADHLDPRCVRASYGTMFAMPLFRVSDPAAVVEFRDAQWRAGLLLRIVGMTSDKEGAALFDVGFTEPGPNGDGDIAPMRSGTILVVGFGSDGLGPAWIEACDRTMHVPIRESPADIGPLLPCASAVVAMYEIMRQQLRF